MRYRTSLLPIILSISLLIPTNLNAYSDLGSICLYIAENDKKRLRKMLKTNRVKIRELYKDIKCNEKSLLQFALERKADDVGIFMVKKIPISSLKKKGVLEWAQSNGFADSEITKALSSRIGS